jgi:predicted DNA-binding protein
MPINEYRKDQSLTQLFLAKDQKKRLKECCGYLNKSMSDFIRDAVDARIRDIETRRQADEDRKAAQKAEKEIKSVRRDLSMKNLPPMLDTLKHRVGATGTRVVTAYEKGARAIFEAKEDDRPAKVREAINAVKREAPLTYGSEEAVVQKLERAVLVLERAKAMRPERVDDEKTGKVVELDGVESVGDFGDEDE